MKLKELLNLLMPEQNVKIYTEDDIPEHEGYAGYTPWWLADMEISENAEIAVDEDGYIEINVTE